MTTHRGDHIRFNFLQLVYAGVLVVAANAVFFLLVLTVNTSIDHGRLFDRVGEAATIGSINDQDYPPDLAIYADRFTDCVGISLNLGGPPDRSPLELMRDMEVPRIEGIGACPSLIQMLRENRHATVANYSRYWHGYQIFSKPFLYFSDVKSLRYVFACLVIIAVMLFSLSISIAFGGAQGPLTGVWFAGGYLLLTDGADLANVFTHSISLFAMFSGAIIAFWALRAGHKRNFFLIAVAIGCVNSFFDLLFNPPLGLSVLIVGATAALCDEGLSARDVLRLALVITVGWAIGFFGTYVCRFALAAVLSDDPLETLKGIYIAGMFRVSGIEEKIRPIFFWATIKNFGYPMLRPSFAVFVVITGIYAARLWRTFHRINVRPDFLVFLIPTFISVLWYEVLRNHSQHHHWFTYRSASFALLCLGSLVIFSLSSDGKSGELAQ
jgi:hypothetical protein